MSIFMGIAVGVLIGGFLGATGMYLFIKESSLDAVLEREAQETGKVTVCLDDEQIDAFMSELKRCRLSAPVLELEDQLEMPQEVKYGDF